MLDEIKEALNNLIKSRIFVLGVAFVVLFGILLQRVFFLQIVKGGDYQESFSLKTEREVSVASTRGNIYDRNGELLAYSELSYSVTIQDNGTYASKTKNPKLNDTIYRLIQLIEKNGDSVVSDLGIVYNNGHYEYSLEGNSLLRLKADVYGKNKISELEPKQELATADELMAYMCGEKKYDIRSSYTEEEQQKYGISVAGYTPEEQLQIATIRFGISANNYKRYVATTVATDVSEETVAAVLENQSELQGAEIEESSRRVYPDSEYFAPIIGYIGKASQDELDSLQEENPDYELNDIVGKSGIEQYMETELQGTKGYEKMYVDSVGRILEVAEQKDAVPGNDVYLTIDKNLQMACYNILEQKLAGILISKIQNTKEYNPGPNASAAKIMIPIYDVYYALINNYIIDTTHFNADDATDLEKSVYSRFRVKLQNTVDSLIAELNSQNAAAYQNLSKEMKNYMSYIVANVLMGDNQVLMKDAVDTSDATYIAWTTDETISLREYLQYAISKNWIDVTKISGDNPYLDSAEIYQSVLQYIRDTLMDDAEFGKMLYKYMLLDDQLSGREICLLLYDQNVLEYDEDTVSRLNSGALSSYTFMLDKIRNLEITPAQLALEPCSGGIVIVDVKTGQTLACVTYPSYDNNRLANGIDAEYYARISSGEDLSRPMWNYATQMRTAPGSTFKMVSSTAALMEHVIDLTTRIECPGIFTRFSDYQPRCWKRSGHGSLNVSEAITNSCNVFFYEVGYQLGLNGDKYDQDLGNEKLAKYASMYGQNEKCGIEIEESEPQISDALSVVSAIGQGTNNFTTVGLARYVTTVANSGTCYDLTPLDKVTDTSGNLLVNYSANVRNTIDMPQSYWNAIHQGMRGVVQNKKYYQDFGVEVAGKTGTAEEDKSRPNHGLFVGYAPYDNPEVSMAIRIANGYSSDYACQLSKQLMTVYFDLDENGALTDSQTALSLETVVGGGD